MVQPDRLKVVVFSGLQGSGKSTMAESISSKLRLPLFSVDPIESAIIRAGIKRSFESGLAAYLVVEALSGEQLGLGHSVVIDAANYVKEAQDMWYRLAKQHKAKLINIECICSDAKTHQQRIENRVRGLHGIPEVTWSDVQKRKKESAKLSGKHLTLDTSDNFVDSASRAIEYIGQS